MQRIEDLRVFLRTAELASFTQAAVSLGIPKANVSAAVMRLEEALGARLLQRTTRKVQLTREGQIFQERCRDVLTDIDELASLFREDGGEVSGRIRVDMPLAFARTHVIPKLPDFLRRHPNLQVEFGCADRRVDLIREGYDCVIRVGGLGDGDAIARKIGTFPIASCASPAYLKRYGVPKRIEDLKKHRLIRYAQVLGTKAEGFEYFDGEAYKEVDMPTAITVNNTEAYVAMCIAGLGIIQAPRVDLEAAITAKQVTEILPEFPAAAMPVYVMYPHRRHLSARVRHFTEWIEEQFQFLRG